MNKLKNENIDLKTQNDNYRNNIMNNDKEKNEYYNKYKELKLKNDSINKQIQDIQLKYNKYQKKMLKQEEKNIEEFFDKLGFKLPFDKVELEKFINQRRSMSTKNFTNIQNSKSIQKNEKYRYKNYAC